MPKQCLGEAINSLKADTMLHCSMIPQTLNRHICSACWLLIYPNCKVKGHLPVLCSFVEQYFVEGASPCKQADSVLEECSTAGLPNGVVPHQREPEAASPLAGDCTAEAATSARLLGSESSMPLSTGHSGSDADDAVLDQSHHSHVAGREASISAPSGEEASSPFANTGAEAAAVLGPDLAAEAQLEGPVKLQSIWVYPVKSCAGFAPSSWPLGLNGFLYDRYSLSFLCHRLQAYHA